jgi:hypothetical protein
MKTTLIVIAVAGGIGCPLAAPAYPVYMPPYNIVQNPTFADSWSHWSGNIQAGLLGWPTMPNGNALLVTDVWQDLPTDPGQQYALDFYMGAAPDSASTSVTVNVNVGGVTLETIVTPLYVYTNTLSLYEQVHWQEVTGLFEATGTTTRLEFSDTTPHNFLVASVSAIAVPEPTTVSLLIGGFGALAISRRLTIRCRQRGIARSVCREVAGWRTSPAPRG